MITPTSKIWHNGKFIDWDDARVHVMTHALHYGTSVFEGIRCYETPSGPAVFRVREHIRRFFDSAKIYRMEDLGFAQETIVDALSELVRINDMSSCYLRPIALRGYGDVGVLSVNNPIEIYLLCWEWGKYLGPEALEKGVDVCISSWTRPRPNTLPAMAKVAANYMNLPIDQDGGRHKRLRGGHRPGRFRVCFRGERREYFPDTGRENPYSLDRNVRPARHYAGHRHPDCRGFGL